MGGSRRDATTPILVHTGARVDAHVGRRSVAIDGSTDSGRRRAPSSTRVEAFSDAVFAIIITLLVLEIGRPEVGHGNLGSELLHQWPEYLAFAASFLYVGVIWLNHHALFSAIRGVDSGLNWINLGILGTSALVPFPRGALASALSEGTRADPRGKHGTHRYAPEDFGQTGEAISERFAAYIERFELTSPNRIR